MTKKITLASVSLAYLVPFLALAQPTPTFTNIGNAVRAFGAIISTVIPVLFGLALVFFLWGLTKFILSAGDEEKKAQAKQIMIWGIIALFIMSSVWGIVAFFQSSFGVTGANLPPSLPIVPVTP